MAEEQKIIFSQKNVLPTKKFKYSEMERLILDLIIVAFQNKPDDCTTFIVETDSYTYHKSCYDIKVLKNIVNLKDLAGSHFLPLSNITQVVFCNDEQYKYYIENMIVYTDD